MTADKDLVGQAVQVPLLELLRDVPENARLRVAESPISSTSYPVGWYCHGAADRIEQLEAKLEQANLECLHHKEYAQECCAQLADANAERDRAELAYRDAQLAARAEPKSSHLNYEGSGRVATSVKDILNSRKVQQQVEAVRQLQTAPPDRAEPQPVAEPLYVIFDGPPAHGSGRFVEVENAAGYGRSVGGWKRRHDGLWSLGPIYAAPPACALGGESELAGELGRLYAHVYVDAGQQFVPLHADTLRRAINALRAERALGFQEAREALDYAADVMERHGWHETAKDSEECLAWTTCRVEAKE